jgi:SlyX protein
MSDSELKARIAELETQLAFQDDLLQSLNQVTIRQEEQILSIIRELKSLREQVSVMSSAPNKANAEEPPPHY